MKINLTHQDLAGNQYKTSKDITYLQLAKHLTFAGIDKWWGSGLFARYLGNLFELTQYYDFIKGTIHPAYPLKDDPTERNYLSNRLGRAIADYLSKDIYKAKYTHSYECAMVAAGIPLTGKRPDFYCDTGTQAFAVEAKGFSVPSVSDNAMETHKTQSASGPILVNFTVASVAFNLYNQPKVKFYDPPSDNLTYNEDLNRLLRAQYYTTILTLIQNCGWFEKEPTSDGKLTRFRSLQRGPRIDILASDGISQGAWRDAGWHIDIEKSVTEYRYIDLDGIGLELVQD